MVRILITDDHELVAEGLKLLLSGEPGLSCAGYARTGREALSLLEQESYDVVLMDIDLPGKNGIETCRDIYHSFPDVKVLVLTMYNQPSFIRQAMKNGASGYLLKNSSKEELVEAIRTVLAGKRYLSRQASQSLIDELCEPDNAAVPLIPELTNREKDVLQLICQGHTTQEIASMLFISHHTAETHRRNLLAKLEVRNTAELVRFAVERGLVD